jgi:uncharacterized protein (TIGR01732 family)
MNQKTAKEGDTMGAVGGYGYGSSAAFVLVLFILLVIILSAWVI